MWGAMKRPSLRRKLKDVLSPSFRDYLKPAAPMVQVATDSELCQEVVGKGLLTQQQMAHAAQRYRLGKSRSGKTIFWLFDEQDRLRDGRLGDQWVTELLKRRYPEFAEYLRPGYCLFGLHLLKAYPQPLPKGRGKCPAGQEMSVCIVDSPRSAVVLSEVYPDSLWLAEVEGVCLTIDLLEPLRGHKVTLFPRTDATMDSYLFSLELADQAHKAYGLDITVSSILEDHCTAVQKSQCYDLVDYLFNS